MKKFLAIVICRLARAVGRLIGKGSSMPGQLALKICPDILSRVALPAEVIAVTASNGKTSTVEMVAAALRGAGKKVVYNAEGSNQIEGVTTMILSACTLSGKVKADVLLLESDERYARFTFRYFQPTVFAILNLYRDQLTRNAHPEWVYDVLKEAVYPSSKLILNADDPLSSRFGDGRGNTVYFGIEPTGEEMSRRPDGAYRDGAYCPVCFKPMDYSWVHNHHFGGYECTGCGIKRPVPEYTLSFSDGEALLNGIWPLKTDFKKIYHYYNALAAFAICRECGLEAEQILSVLNGFVLKNGRRVQFNLGAHPAELLVSKHENSVAYDGNLQIAVQDTDPHAVMIIVDAISRKYFTGETSWLWDIDFDMLNTPELTCVVLAGKYACDLEERFSYTALPPEKITVCPSIAEAAEGLIANGSEKLYVLTCFSDKDKILSRQTAPAADKAE